MYAVGEVIKEARRRHGWGQRRLAEVSGVSQPNIAAIERGARTPSLAMVSRLVRACGLQLRYELEPRHADVDAAIEALLDRPPEARLGRTGLDALTTAWRLAMKGAPLVLDGALAARLSGAAVVETDRRVWCDHAELDQLRRAAVRCYLDIRPMRPRFDDDLRPVLVEGGEVRIGGCLVRLGPPPPAPWAVRFFGATLPVVGIERLLADPEWAPADRVAVRRLATVLGDRDEAGHGLDRAP